MFRVQASDVPGKTMTKHLQKDGHAFIHYAPEQCRSLSVREAARAQTFPDNYYFVGLNGAAYAQIGNAVPPYMAYQLAKMVNAIFVEAGLRKK